MIIPSCEIEISAAFYSELFGHEGVRVSPGRHYYPFGGQIMAIYDPKADGDDEDGGVAIPGKLSILKPQTSTVNTNAFV